MSHTGIAFLPRPRSVRKAFLALSLGLGMAALFLLSGIGPLGPAAHAALSPPDAQRAAPAAKWGNGPYDGQHCHRVGEQVEHHSHRGFHSGIPKNWSNFWDKYKAYFPDPTDAADGWKRSDDHDVWADSHNDGNNDEYKIVTFRESWRPDDDPHWHNHGDDDTHWWTPDEDDSDNCLFSPEFVNEPYKFDVAESAPIRGTVGHVQAHDEDGQDPAYTLEGTDSASFSIGRDTGDLTVKATLDYETKNSYSMTVRATDPSGGYDTADVTITVDDVEEPGVVTLSPAQPRVGAALTASLTDGDGDVTDVTWQWARSATQGGPYADITTNGTSANYTPVPHDDGKYLRATATYTDRRDSGKTAKAETTNAVQAAPYFDPAMDTTRSVAEDASAGTDIGDPVEVANAHGSFTYTLGGTDGTSFAIDSTSGQLRTKAALNYEGKSSYRVTVTARDAARKSATVTVTITVTNVEEPGKVTLSSQQPRVGVALRASLTDLDGVSGTPTWQWASADSSTPTTWKDISGATSASYTPKAEDVDDYLQATASYNDGEGSGKRASKVSVNVVKQPNRAPAFPDQDPGTAGEQTEQTREVAENTPANRNIGDPVEANDPDNDRLTYTLGGTNAGSFNIVAESGQLQTKAALDHETKPSYSVTVTARDTSQLFDTVTVTINVTDVDEPGVVALSSSQPRVGTPLTATLTDPDRTVSSRVTWQWARSATRSGTYVDITANGTSARYTPVAADVGNYLRATASYNDGYGNKTAQAVSDNAVGAATANRPPVFGSNAAATESIAENTPAGRNVGNPVTATDQDTGDTLTYTLEGTDRAYFAIGSTTGQLRTGAVLDYENPADTGADNVYDITVRVSDSVNTVTKGVAITVTDVDEPGVVTLSASQPRIGEALTATLRDPDGTVSGKTWQWARSATRNGAYADISGATSASYTPVAGDLNKYLRATVSYTDRHGSGKSVNAVAANAVRAGNRDPSFSSRTMSRSIAENAAANANVGSPVAATDPDNDPLTYTLGGTDAASFTIVASTGQLRTRAALDRAAKASHTVTVSVRDSRDSSGNADTAMDDTTTVTITVTDVNVPPVFPDQDPDTQGDQEEKTLAVAENTPPGRNIGGPSPATDADSDALTYSLGGADAASFGIVASTGQLLTKSPLDYETRNRYRVTVTAADTSSASDAVTVNINVTNLDETGTVTLSSAWPRVGVPLTAALSDPDVPVTAKSWQWQRSNSGNGSYSSIRGATSATYRPVAGDVGKYLRATVAYTDRHGTGKSEWSAPGNPVARPRANAAPVFAANTATRSIAENTPANRNIGAPVAATDPDTGTGDRLTYALSGTDAASFGIVASSGQLRTRAALDYERKRSYSVTVTVTDTAGASDTIAVTIGVTNIDIPGKPGTPAVAAASASGHSALSVRWTAPGAGAVIGGYDVQYRAGTSGNWYSIRSIGTSTTVSGLVSDTMYQVRVRAYNSEGRSGWSNTGQGRTDAAPIQQQRVLRQPTRTPTVCTPGIGFRTGVPWSFTAARGGEDPPDVFLEVWNRDLCAMDFRVSSGAKWLSISPASGRSEGAHQEKQIRISADISGLDVGTHTAAIRITAPKGGNSPQTVSVSLTITKRAPPESNYCQERTVIESSDSAFRVVVPANSAPCDTGITVESLDADSQQTPVGEGVRVVGKVVRAGQVSAASADTRINAALWALLPGDRVSACEEAAEAAVYRVVDGDSWDLLTHRCEMDEQGRVWMVLPLTGFGVYVVTLPAPFVESGAVGEARLQTPEAAESDTSPATPSPETMASNGPASSLNAVESQPTPAPKPEVAQVEVQPTPAPGPDVVHADASPAGLWADLPPEELALPVMETGQSPPRRLGSLGILLYILAPIILIIALLLIMFGVRNLRGAESASP